MATTIKERIRDARSVFGLDSWTVLNQRIEHKAQMLDRDQLEKIHADKMIKDAEQLEKSAARLREIAQHVYNGTKPNKSVQEVELPTDPEELKKMVLQLQKKTTRLQSKLKEQKAV